MKLFFLQKYRKTIEYNLHHSSNAMRSETVVQKSFILKRKIISIQAGTTCGASSHVDLTKRTMDWGLRTQDRGLRTEDWGVKTGD